MRFTTAQQQVGVGCRLKVRQRKTEQYRIVIIGLGPGVRDSSELDWHNLHFYTELCEVFLDHCGHQLAGFALSRNQEGKLDAVALRVNQFRSTGSSTLVEASFLQQRSRLHKVVRDLR